MTKQRFFVAGTDTGIGKTLVSAALLLRANEAGLKTLGLKPVAAGCENTEQGLRNEDAIALSHAASVSLPYEQINPIALQDPVSPHIAAKKMGKRLSADRIVGYCRGAMMTPHDVCIVEGAGGWRVPIGPRETMADVAKALAMPVVLVVGVRLGCLNHAFLTAEAVVRDGLKIAGWVANIVDPDTMALDENIATLSQRLPFQPLGVIPHKPDITPEAAAQHLDISKLLDFS